MTYYIKLKKTRREKDNSSVEDVDNTETQVIIEHHGTGDRQQDIGEQ